jgi:hypothetical protein
MIASFALTEPEAGSDAASLRTTAIRGTDAQGDHYIVNGTKRYITNAPQAGIFTLMARTNPADKGAGGVSAFIVEANTPGITIGKATGRWASAAPTPADVIFENCRVPAANLIGGARAGLQDGDEGAGKGAHPHRRHLRGRGRAHAARRAALCHRAPPVRPADRRVPAGAGHAGRQPGRDLRGAVHGDGRRAPARRRRERPPRHLLQALRQRDVRPRGRPRGADLRRLPAMWPNTASSASTATCGCSASTKAPARSSRS